MEKAITKEEALNFMAVVDTSRFYKGLKIEYEGGIWEVLEYHHSKIAQRSPVVKTKLRNIISSSVQEKNFRSGETFEVPDLERKAMLFLYSDDIGYHFMDSKTYDQLSLNKELVGESARFLKEQQEIVVVFYRNEPIGVDLPVAVEMVVAKTEPGVRGDSVSAGSKPATLESGATISVPLFIEEGDIIKVDTRTGDYLERVKKK